MNLLTLGRNLVKWTSYQLFGKKKKINKEGVILKIDIEKSYDHVEWEFVD